ncbi:MAG: tetratricopeptide repeat protein [Endomicrobia bacterium]|nr:tetratricopeptide repeat protein [Endomicrobiia bacterium]
MTIGFKFESRLFLFFLIVGIIIRLPSLNAPFIWDDEAIILNNNVIKSVANISEIFKSDMFGQPMREATQFYRPITLLSFMLNWVISKDRTFFYHLTNTFLHIINSFLVFLILNNIVKNKLISSIVSSFFLISPVNINTTTYISNRTVLLGTLFAYAVILLYIYRQHFLSIIFFILSILSKEDFVVLPCILFCYWFLVQKKAKDYPPTSIIGMVFILVIYIIIRFSMPVYFIPTSFLSNENHLVRTLTFIRSIFFYIYKLLIPINVPFEKHFIERNLFSIYTFLFFILVCVAIVVYKTKKENLFFILFFVVSLIPTSNIVLPLSATLRSHNIYFASFVPMAYICMYMFSRFVLIPKLTKLLFFLFLFIYFVLNIYQAVYHTSLWNDKEKFYLKQIQLEPNSYLCLNNLGLEYVSKRDYDKAKEYFLLSIERSPNSSYSVAWNNLGVMYQRTGEIDKAIDCYKKSIYYGEYYLAYKNLLEVLYFLGDKEDFKNILSKALKRYPDDQYLIRLISLLNK